MKTVADRIRIGALVLAALAGLIAGLILGQRGLSEKSGSRVAWPEQETSELSPKK